MKSVVIPRGEVNLIRAGVGDILWGASWQEVFGGVGTAFDEEGALGSP